MKCKENSLLSGTSLCRIGEADVQKISVSLLRIRGGKRCYEAIGDA